MEFENLRIKDIKIVTHYTPSVSYFESVGKKAHIIGIELSGYSDHEFDSNNKKLVLKTNTVYFLNKDEDYKVKVIEKGTSFSVHFTTEVPVSTESFCISVSSSEETVALLDRIKRCFEKEGSSLRAISLLYELCARFDELKKKKYAPSDIRAIKGAEYLNVHFKEKDCIEGAAKVCGISTRRFNDIFKARFNATPNKYVCEKKISLAKNLLSSEPFSVSEAAELCGFSDVYYFSKVFKSEVGMPPSEFIKQVRT